jgi:hypothetical protein
MGAVAIPARSAAGPALQAGAGLRLPHLAEVATAAPAVAWLEVHPENFLANPHAHELLLEVAQRYPLSVHTVGLSVGSATGLDREHLMRLVPLVDELDPVLVSGHLAWSSHAGVFLNDLLPLPYDDESLRVVVTHVHEVQDALGRTYLLENPASYLGFAASTLTEAEFLHEVVARTGCRLLCDLGNAHVSAMNLGQDAYRYVDALPADAIAELHLGGFTAEPDEATPGGEVLIDTHASAIAEPVWALYAYAIARFGPRPTLVEWDNALPPFARIAAEAARADAVAAEALGRSRLHAAAR